jgi:phenylalanyl-tRNA synthetase beta chain
MRVSLSWLRELVPVTQTVEELTAAFDSLGLVVEGVEHVGGGNLTGIIIACGAWNFSEGDRIPLATLGTTMPNGMKIEARKLRGEMSNGMLCSGRELELSDDHDGIWILPKDTPLGVPITEALGLTPDVVFDLSVEANRPDAMSMRGVARDLGAKLGIVAKDPAEGVYLKGVLDTPNRSVDTVSAPDLCDRLTTTIIEGVRVTESPAWVQDRLTMAGMRPISNLVDASNYVMLELGAPSHAFDLDKLAGQRIGVRWAHEGEQIVTLDGQTRTLSVGSANDDHARDGVIVDGNDVAIGIAAVMGGQSTEVSASTTRLLLEIAHWSPMAVARTSKRLNLRSEASARYERNSDAEVLTQAAVRFVEICRESCPDIRVTHFDNLLPNGFPEAKTVRVRTDRANLILGTSIDDATIIKLITPIGFKVTAVSAGQLDVTIPSWRTDCEAEINVIEEIGRHFGYDNIARVVPLSPMVGRLTQIQKDRRRLRSVLVGLGLNEAWTPTLIGEDELVSAGLPVDRLVRLSNPLVAEESVLRPSLTVGALRALRHNTNHRNAAVRLFESGHVFDTPRPRQIVPYEREHMAVALAGDGDDALSARRVFDALAHGVGVVPAAIEIVADDALPGMHPTRSARIIGAGTGFPIGAVGEIDPDVLARWGIERRVGWLWFDFEKLCGLPRHGLHLSAFSKYPSSDVDFAFVTPDTVPAAALLSALRNAAGDLCETVSLFDVYSGKGVVDGSRSLAVRVRLVAPDRTLADADLVKVREQCLAAASAVGATLRS